MLGVKIGKVVKQTWPEFWVWMSYDVPESGHKVWYSARVSKN